MLTYTKSLLVFPLVGLVSACGIVTGDKGSDATVPQNSVAQEPKDDAKQGSSGKKSKVPSPKELLNSFEPTHKALKSYTIHIEDPHNKDAKNLVVSGFKDSKDARCKMTTRDGAVMEMLVFADKTYVKGDEKYWKSADAGKLTGPMLKSVLGKWVEMPTGAKNAMSLDTFSDVWRGQKATWMDNFGSKVEEVDYDGQPALKLTDRGDDTSHAITKREKPYHILEVSMVADEKKGPEKTVIRFTDHDAVQPIVRPPAKDILKVPSK